MTDQARSAAGLLARALLVLVFGALGGITVAQFTHAAPTPPTPQTRERLSGDALKRVRYSFADGTLVNPRIIETLHGWMSDSSETITSIDLAASNESNQFGGEMTVKNIGGKKWVFREGEHGEYFGYHLIAITPRGVHLVECALSGGGSGVFESIMLVVLETDHGLTNENAVGMLASHPRLLISTLGSIGLGDRYGGEIFYAAGRLTIGPDVGMKHSDRTQAETWTIE